MHAAVLLLGAALTSFCPSCESGRSYTAAFVPAPTVVVGSCCGQSVCCDDCDECCDACDTCVSCSPCNTCCGRLQPMLRRLLLVRHVWLRNHPSKCIPRRLVRCAIGLVGVVAANTAPGVWSHARTCDATVPCRGWRASSLRFASARNRFDGDCVYTELQQVLTIWARVGVSFLGGINVSSKRWMGRNRSLVKAHPNQSPFRPGN